VAGDTPAPLSLIVFRVAAASPPQTERGETPRPLPEVLIGVWGRAPAETTLSSLLPTHWAGAGMERACSTGRFDVMPRRLDRIRSGVLGRSSGLVECVCVCGSGISASAVLLHSNLVLNPGLACKECSRI